jgi:hypothetical protein
MNGIAVFLLDCAVKFSGQSNAVDCRGLSERFNGRAGHSVAVFSGWNKRNKKHGGLQAVQTGNSIRRPNWEPRFPFTPSPLDSKILMFTKTHLTLFAATFVICGTTYGQSLQLLTPSSLGLSPNTSAINQVFDIGDQFGYSPSDIQLQVANGHTANGADVWTVSELESATFSIISNLDVAGFVQHGQNLGSSDFQNGSASVDGLIANPGEDFTLISIVDPDYTQSISGNRYSVAYTGADTGALESNSVPLRWVSDQPISGFDVFTTNSVDLNNNYAIGFGVVSSVPEPSSAVLIACVSSLCLLRRKRR